MLGPAGERLQKLNHPHPSFRVQLQHWPRLSAQSPHQPRVRRRSFNTSCTRADRLLSIADLPSPCNAAAIQSVAPSASGMDPPPDGGPVRDAEGASEATLGAGGPGS
ncbi:hypothetical protein THAOC_27678, partial [Thalassiosira oceanica]